MIATQSAVFSTSAAIYEQRYGEQCMKEIDAYVKDVAVRPCNSDELMSRKKSVMSSTGLRLDKVHDIVSARCADGAYDELLAAIPPALMLTSVPRNLRRIGVAL